jgi:hypothetical protein
MTEMLMRGAKKLGAYFNGKNKKRVGLPLHRTENKIPLFHRDANWAAVVGM